jgi:hypothetical protein
MNMQAGPFGKSVSSSFTPSPCKMQPLRTCSFASRGGGALLPPPRNTSPFLSKKQIFRVADRFRFSSTCRRCSFITEISTVSSPHRHRLGPIFAAICYEIRILLLVRRTCCINPNVTGHLTKLIICDVDQDLHVRRSQHPKNSTSNPGAISRREV